LGKHRQDNEKQEQPRTSLQGFPLYFAKAHWVVNFNSGKITGCHIRRPNDSHKNDNFLEQTQYTSRASQNAIEEGSVFLQRKEEFA
jgi:hypothetical protein